jgi:PIN domain nuclease of toxin-antitoxin system
LVAPPNLRAPSSKTSSRAWLSDASFDRVIARAAEPQWTRDPFECLIVGNAAEESAPLVTRDRGIRGHYPDTVW